MSDSMEREKNERLRMLEEEEMKRVLTGIGIYEPGITYKQMKRLLEFVNESQDTSNIANNKNTQEGTQHSDNECLSDITTNVNVQQEVTLQESTEMPRPSYSYKTNCTSPTMHERKTAHYINNPESPSLVEARNSVYKPKTGSDSEELFDISNSTHSTNRFPSLRLSSRECQKAAEKRMSQDAQGEVVQKLEKWRLNPLDVCINDENDVPLRQPARPLARERMPFEHCKEVHVSDQCDQVIRSMSQHLKEMADLWYTWRPITNPIFQWGSPIQVGPANGSLDKKPLTESKTEQIETAECIYRDGYERASKRKANTIISSLNRESSTEDEAGDRYDFVRVKKKKAKFNKSNEESDTNRNAHINHKKATSNVIHFFSDDNSDTEINNENVKHLDSKIKSDEKDDKTSPELTAYPRRIIPPNPKARVGLNRQKRVNATSKTTSKTQRVNKNNAVEQIKNQTKDNTLTEEEIRQKLEDDLNDEEEEAAVENNVEIRSLPVSINVRSRLRQKQLSISKTKTAKKTMQGGAKKEEESDEENKKKKFKVSEQQKEELCEKVNKNGSWEHQLLSDEEDKSSEMTREFAQEFTQNGNQSNNVPISTNNVSCPICNKLFPHNEIENHAADCNQFETNNEEDDDNNKNQLECHICNKYKTSNGIKLEEHVNQCIKNRIDQKHSRGNCHITLQSTLSSEMKFFILALWISCLISVRCQVITLNGAWTGTINICDKKPFEKCDNDVNFSATVPGGIYTDLYKNNIIDDNLVGKNDVNNRWVGNQSVIYTKYFNVNDNFLKARKIILVFHGVDTFANISLNNHAIGKTSNMFLRYSFDVTDFIKKGQNLLEITFRSAVKVAEDLYNEQKKNYIVPPVCVPTEYNGQCHVNHIRKMQASFSWDWGPAFPSIGIWKDVELIPVNDILINDITADIRKENNSWNVLVTIFLETAQSKDEKVTKVNCHVASILHISQSKLITNVSEVLLDTSGKYRNINISLIVPVNAVRVWWPNGYGKQYLYYLTTIVTTADSVLYKRIRIGFRTVELVEEPLEKGLSFYFRINGIPIFAKGSNFIPASVFPELGAKEDTIRHLLLSAKQTHMNMLRVWGGGVYESKLFYDLADEYGIMIWQDFMFACAMYPTSDIFLQNVREEVLQNVIRLKNHPSIVLWAGNNENEAALYGNWYGTGTAQVYKEDYVKLYVNLLKTEVEKLDPIRPFVVSSPGNGAYAKTYNYTGVNPYSNLYGDVHYYNYLKNGWDINQYPRTRFCSEYGFQSWPSINTIATAIENVNDLHVDSDFVKHRQHLPLGNVFMRMLISHNFAIPQSNNSIRDFRNYVYLSQINQAVSIKIETEAYRQAKSEVNSVGEGMTMGALYWQLNDVWQAPSWSSIDVKGRWKMLHYYAKDFFAPVIITSHLSISNNLSIYIVSDRIYTFKNCTVKIDVYKWESMKPIFTLFFNNTIIESNKSVKITSFWLDKFLSEVGCGSLKSAKKSCIATLSLTNKYGFLIAPINYVYPDALKNADVSVANVTMRIEKNHLPGKLSNYPDFKIILSTDNIALFVWLEVGNIRGRFSENGFHIFVKEKIIIFHAHEATSIELLQDNIKLTHLSDIYSAHGNFDGDFVERAHLD
ncbi:beta-mannosidase isoform X2 [Solenopsis invicta]|uniref:beta-mannosidase isoform X2 n=1 Tax=Solenopsis invicta TaxID=13686 RepID=UPI000E33E3FB|nr:beta-mannosidase isoform X2 [Solenopsis invicta]